MAAVRVNRLMRAMWRFHRWLYAKSNGRIGVRTGAQRLLLLTTTGRRSGQPRSVVLTYVDAASRKVVVASYAGENRQPDWYLNLTAHPRATIRIGNEEQPVRARQSPDPNETISTISSLICMTNTRPTNNEPTAAYPSSLSNQRPEPHRTRPRRSRHGRPPRQPAWTEGPARYHRTEITDRHADEPA